MEIKSSDTLVTTSRTTSISIGSSRVGKTHFIGTMADCGKLFVLDTEGGLSTIEGKKFDYVTVNTWAEAEEVLNWVMMEAANKKYTHFAIDSINRLQVYLIDDITAKPDEFGKNKGMMTMQKYGTLAAKLKKIVDVLTKSLPLSVHMNVTAMESKDEVTGAVLLYPAIAGGFKHEILGYFDNIFYHRAALDGGEQKYWIQLGSDSRIQAGTRVQALKNKYGTVMPNDYNALYELITSNDDVAKTGE